MSGFAIAARPAARFGEGAIRELPGVIRATGAEAVLVVTDADAHEDEVLANTPRVPTGADIGAILLAS